MAPTRLLMLGMFLVALDLATQCPYQRKILFVRGTSLIIIELYQSAEFYQKCLSIVFCQDTNI